MVCYRCNYGLLFVPMILCCLTVEALNIISSDIASSSVTSRRQFALHLPAITAAVSTAISTNTPQAYAEESAPTSSHSSSIAERLESDILRAPSITAGVKPTGHENLYFPPWLEGEWDATQTLIDTKAPLGLKYVGGPQGSLEIAQKTLAEQAKRVNEPVNLKLRFVNTNFGVVEDRAFNLKQRLDSFAGKQVVASVEYADVRESNRASILAAGGKESDPLSTTLVYFKGPAAQKSFVISHGQDSLESDEWAGYELDRSIFALTNQSTAPPVTTDQEAIYSFKRVGNDKVEGRLRLVGYLNPQADTLYFETKNRGVSITDYTLSLRARESS